MRTIYIVLACCTIYALCQEPHHVYIDRMISWMQGISGFRQYIYNNYGHIVQPAILPFTRQQIQYFLENIRNAVITRQEFDEYLSSHARYECEAMKREIANNTQTNQHKLLRKDSIINTIIFADNYTQQLALLSHYHYFSASNKKLGLPDNKKRSCVIL